MRVAGYLILVAAALASLVFVNVLKPTSFTATAALSAWLALPYAVLALVLRLSAKPHAATIVAALVATGGLLFLANVIFLNPDPQGGIAVIFTPLYQAFAIAFLLPALHYLLRKKNVGRR